MILSNEQIERKTEMRDFLKRKLDNTLKGVINRARIDETAATFEIVLPEAGVSVPYARSNFQPANAKDDFYKACELLQDEFQDLVDPANGLGDFKFSWPDGKSAFTVVILKTEVLKKCGTR